MQESLGIYISDKLIKYAKVEKNNNNEFKVNSNGIKFYDNLELQNTVKQVIEETNSSKIPISINISNEKYYYFNFFSLTNKNYVKKAIETEFESFCADNHLNRNALEGRYIYSKDETNSDKNKVIYVYESKGDLDERAKAFKGYNLTTAVPTTAALYNIIKPEKNKNVMIVDLNENTTITTIINQEIYNVDTIEEGLKEAFDSINEKENSYLKTYDVLKNTTIYTMEMQQNTPFDVNSQYLQIIVPSLYKIAQEIENIMKNYKKIDQIYLTGIGTTINNIDLYFQEFIKEAKIEILKPFFAEGDTSINMKDYIEVNSAIALAIQGLGFGAKTLNFAGGNGGDKFKSLLTMDIKDIKLSKGSMSAPKIDFGSFGDAISGITNSATAVLVFMIIAYCVCTSLLNNELEKKKAEARDVTADTKSQITQATQTDSKVTQRTTDYIKYKTNLENINSAIETKRSRKNQIPNLLNKIIYTIPKEVQLTEIKNTENNDGKDTVQHIIIYAQSKKYEQLAYFKARLKNANILDDIVSTEGTKDGETVKVVIEGDLRNY
ncbi:MAG: hypothetical protein IKG56_00965 [Clostridia bacterium]|nr:hypothetical protein [Clostridia bacterium]